MYRGAGETEGCRVSLGEEGFRWVDSAPSARSTTKESRQLSVRESSTPGTPSAGLKKNHTAPENIIKRCPRQIKVEATQSQSKQGTRKGARAPTKAPHGIPALGMEHNP